MLDCDYHESSQGFFSELFSGILYALLVPQLSESPPLQ